MYTDFGLSSFTYDNPQPNGCRQRQRYSIRAHGLILSQQYSLPERPTISGANENLGGIGGCQPASLLDLSPVR
jgi:hypothetical protein